MSRLREPGAALRIIATLGSLLVMAACSSIASSAAPGGTPSSPAARSSLPPTTATPPTTVPPPAADRAKPARIFAPSSNLPDPFVLVTPSGYYLFSSQANLDTPPISVAFSRDPSRWPPSRAAMASVPAWAADGFTWAPDVRWIDGRYVLYFNAWARSSLYLNRASKGFAAHAQCIGAATSARPEGPYRPVPRPLVCQFDHHGAIDPRTFQAPDGQLWLDWKSDDNANAPGPIAPTHLFAQRLSTDGLSLVGRRSQLLQAAEPWQIGIIEAPDMVYVNGVYWLFYSGNWFNQPAYAIGVARCSGPAGPCVDRSTPWLASNPQGQGPGEESLFQDRAGRWWITYSAWYKGYLGRENRPVALALVGFGPSGPYPAAR